jgi:hypothetical protein
MHLKGQGGTIKYFLLMTVAFSGLLFLLTILAFFNTIPGTHR